MADNSLTNAVDLLGTNIGTLSTKVAASKTSVAGYKAQIIAKLTAVLEQLESLKTNNKLTEIPKLRLDLLASQGELQAKTADLNSATQQFQVLQDSVVQLNRQIVELTNLGGEKDGAIRALNEQKQAAETKTSELVVKINAINTNLAHQIELIDTTVSDLGNLNSGDVVDQFSAVGTNIEAIMNMINGIGADPTNITGGKSRRHKRRGGRKTMKKRNKRTKKLMKNLKGGYVYSSSKDLDKASSIIRASSKPNSKSKSKSNKKAHKTKRRSSKQ